MLLAVEPVFRDETHAPVNACLLQALGLAAPDEGIVFASHPGHREGVLDNARELSDRIGYMPINVGPGGGITFARFRRSFSALLSCVRAVEPSVLLCLAVAPETIFACALLKLLRPRLPCVVVLHGDLAPAAYGWRSRDPRRRWFDHRSAIRVAVASGLKPVVLESYIRDGAEALGLLPTGRCDVWPHPIAEIEMVPTPPSLGADPLDIGFVGFAKKAKGFDEFIRLAAIPAGDAGSRCRFNLVGQVAEREYEGKLQNIRVIPDVTRRGQFLEAVRSLDYVCMLLQGDTYSLTSSGTILDAIAALRPIVGLETTNLRAMFDGQRIGYLCSSQAELETLFANPTVLLDRVAYRQFQEVLARVQRERSPRLVAEAIRRTLHGLLNRP